MFSIENGWPSLLPGGEISVASSSSTSMKKKWSTFLTRQPRSRSLSRLGAHVPEQVSDDGVLVSQSQIAISQVCPLVLGRSPRNPARARLTAIVEVDTEMWWDVPCHPHLHASFPEPIELYFQPVQLKRAGVIGMVSASIHHYAYQQTSRQGRWIGDIQVFASYQNKVLSEMTASVSGMTSTEKYAPRSKTWPSSSGM